MVCSVILRAECEICRARGYFQSIYDHYGMYVIGRFDLARVFLMKVSAAQGEAM